MPFNHILQLNKISCSYQEAAVITNFSLCCRAGELTVLTGPSGCGKTTVLRLVNGLIPEVYPGEITGEMTYDGQSLLSTDIKTRSRQIGTVYQNPKNQFFCAFARDEIAFPLENKNTPREEILSQIEKHSRLLGTEGLLERNVFRLSGGQKQLIALTSISVMEPEIILLDEPSSSLDHEAVEQLQQVLALWKAAGKIILVAEHRLYYLYGLADRWVTMQRGGPAEEWAPKAFTAEISRSQRLRRLEDISTEELRCGKGYLQKNVRDRTPNSLPDSIHFKNYRWTYSRRTPLLDFDLSVRRRGITFLIGRNGVGKSSFLRCMAGLNRSFRGETSGPDFHYRSRGWQHVAMVMQDVNHQLFTESVLDEVKLATHDKSEARRLLHLLALEEKEAAHPFALSGGEKQRLAIACALGAEREILIFDEPTSGLDYENMKKLSQTLMAIAASGRKIFLVTHDRELIACTPGDLVELV